MDDPWRITAWRSQTPPGGIHTDAANGTILEDVRAHLAREVDAGPGAARRWVGGGAAADQIWDFLE